MIKEALIVLFIFILFLIVGKIAIKKWFHIFFIFAVFCLVGLATLNIAFTIKNYLPEFILDDQIPLGDFSENLLLYKADSEYRSQILFPAINNRNVLCNKDITTYHKLLSTFSKSFDTISVSSQELNGIISNQQDFIEDPDFYLADLLDYVVDGNSIDVTALPSFYFNLNSFRSADTLVALTLENNDLYLMSLEYFEKITERTIK